MAIAIKVFDYRQHIVALRQASLPFRIGEGVRILLTFYIIGHILYYTEYNLTYFLTTFPISGKSGFARAGIRSFAVHALRIDVTKWGRRIAFINICQENSYSHQHVGFLVTEVILHWGTLLPTCFSTDANSTIRFLSVSNIRFCNGQDWTATNYEAWSHALPDKESVHVFRVKGYISRILMASNIYSAISKSAQKQHYINVSWIHQ